MESSLASASLLVLAAMQCVAATRVIARLARKSRFAPLVRAGDAAPPGSVAVVIPVLDEAARLAPALRSVTACGGEVREILVVDGGSRDATVALANAFARRDARVRVIAAGDVPAGWNGKAHNLTTSLRALDAPFFLGIDADVRIDPALPSALFAAATATHVNVISVATRQKTSGIAAIALHAALLATLVYRSGRPGVVSRKPGRVQANGQVFFAPATLLRATGALDASRASRCDDLTIAHTLAAAGEEIAFVEAPGLAVVSMYANALDTARNWPRSLTLRDDATRRIAPLRLVEALLVQALPLLIVGIFIFVPTGTSLACTVLRMVNIVLFCTRLGVLAGTARAYEKPRLGYWLSPLLDLPAVLLLAISMGTRRVAWRGRALVNTP